MIKHRTPISIPSPAYEPLHKCPTILEHPFYPAWFQTAVIVLESFFIGLIAGKFL